MRALASARCTDARGEFNNASARRALVDWYLSLFIMCKAGHQYNERPRALALLNLPQALHITNKDKYQSTSARRALALLNSPQCSPFYTNVPQVVVNYMHEKR